MTPARLETWAESSDATGGSGALLGHRCDELEVPLGPGGGDFWRHLAPGSRLGDSLVQEALFPLFSLQCTGVDGVGVGEATLEVG